MERTRRGVLAGVCAALTAGCNAPVRSADGTAGPTTDRATGRGTGGQGGSGTGGTASPDGASGTDAVAGFSAAYRRVIPSVVLVRVYGADGPSGEGSAFVAALPGADAGGGGHLVTNDHVVDGADAVRVQFRRGEWRRGRVLGTDPYSDLAALRVPNRPAYARPLSFVETQPPVGTPVMALGSPLGLGGSASSGIVSGQDRSLPAPSGFTIADAVQTDAALNPGNSGGPLVDRDGRVVGVVSAAGGENIGFAISTALTRRVVPALVRDGEYAHSFMGIQAAPVTPLLAEANDLRRARGVYVAAVRPNGPAAGMLRGSDGEARVAGTTVPTGGDVIVAMNDREIPTTAAMSTFLALRTRPGDTVAVTVLRGGQRRTVDLTLGERPPP